MQYTISNAREDDCPRIEDIGRRSLPLYYDVRQLSAFVSDSKHAVIKLSTDTGHLIGFVVVDLRSKCGRMHINSFAVDEEHRGKGLGTAILQYMQRYKKPLTLYVDTDNMVAYNCYTRNGFVLQRTIRGYYQTLGKDAYLMVWSYKQPVYGSHLNVLK